MEFHVSYEEMEDQSLSHSNSTVILLLNDANPGTLLFKDNEGVTKLYKLAQFHFHAPSEHTIGNKSYDAELHIVHKQYETGDVTVLAVLFDASKDIESGFLEELELQNINITNPTHVEEQLYVPLMEYVQRIDASFYHYKGSLTTPPCTEGVNFVVLSQVQYITLADKALFNKWWGGNKQFAKGNGNNRAVQKLNGRTVYYKLVTLEQHEAQLMN